MTVILIDGRSGSGKTELARALVEAHPEFQLVQLDDLYPGWDGLEAASVQVPRILAEGRWQSWDWSLDQPGAIRQIAPDGDIVVEGSGALTRASRSLADHTVWVELGDEGRKLRALARDGDTYRPHWDRWARQEEAHLAREHPRDLADLVVDGTSARDALSAVERMLGRR